MESLQGEVVVASAADVDGVMRIVKSIVSEMHSANNSQWDDDYPNREILLEDVAARRLFVYKDAAGAVLGFIVAYASADPYFSDPGLHWHHMEADGFLVVHRFGTSTEHRHMGVARRLEEFVADLGRSDGKSHLRVDTYSLNRPMRGFLEKRGWQLVGEIPIAWDGVTREFPFAVYDKSI